jgi:hypothetical protein
MILARAYTSWGRRRRGNEPLMPKQKPSLRSIADAMAGDAAGYALLAPPEERDDVIAKARCAVEQQP